MAREGKLVKDTMLYGVANFGTSFLSFLMLPLYTSYFTTSEFGLWDLIMTTTTLLSPLISFELVAAVYRWLLDATSHQEKQTIITTGTSVISRNLLIFNGFALLGLIFYTIPYGWLALALVNISIVSGFLQQSARGLRHNKLFASLGIIQSAIIVLLNLCFIYILKLRVEAFFYSFIIAGVCIIIFSWRKMNFGQYIRLETYSKGMKKHFLTYSIPIIPGAMSWWVITLSDRYIITVYLGIEINGIYAVANKIPALLLMVSSIFSLAWKDSAIIEYTADDKDDYYSTVFRTFFKIMTTSLICLTLLAKPILALFIGEAFYSAWKYIGILLLGTLFNAFSLFWSAGFHGAKKTNVILGTTIVGAVINIILNLLLIKYIGLYAVGLSSVAAFLITWILRIHYAKPYFTIKLPLRDMKIFFTLGVIAIIVPFWVSGVWLGISICLAVGGFLWWNREMWWRMVADFKK